MDSLKLEKNNDNTPTDYKFGCDKKEILIKRFNKYSKVFSTKEDAIVEIWTLFIQEINKNKDNDIHSDILKKTLEVSGYSNNLSRLYKTYIRLWMHEYFINKLEVVFKKDENSDEISDVDIVKNVNLIGLLEIIIRVILPMNIVKNLIIENQKFNKINDENYRILRSFARDDLSAVAYQITNLKPNLLHNNKIDKNTIGAMGGRYFNKNEHFDYFKELFGETGQYYHLSIKKVKTEKDIYVTSFFNQLSFILEIIQLYSNNREIGKNDKSINKIISHYTYHEYEFKFLKEEIKKLIERINVNDIFNFEIKNSSLGILSLQRFTEDLIKNFEIIEEKLHDEINKEIPFPDKNFLSFIIKKRIIFSLSAYLTSFLNHLLILIVNSQSLKDFYLTHNYVNIGANKSNTLKKIKLSRQENYFFKNLNEFKRYISKNQDKNLVKIYDMFIKFQNLNPVWNEIVNFSYYSEEIDEKQASLFKNLENILTINEIDSKYVGKNFLDLKNLKDLNKLIKILNYFLEKQGQSDDEKYLIKQKIVYDVLKNNNSYFEIHKKDYKINIDENKLIDEITKNIKQKINDTPKSNMIKNRILINFNEMISENKFSLEKADFERLMQIFRIEKEKEKEKEKEFKEFKEELNKIFLISKNMIISEFKKTKQIKLERIEILEFIQNYALMYELFNYEELKDLNIELNKIYETINASPNA